MAFDGRPGGRQPGEHDRHGAVRALYRSAIGRTTVAALRETGVLRMRHPRAPSCEGVILNTGGGIVGGDRLAFDVTLDTGATVTLTTAAAEKVYRAGLEASIVTVRLALAAGSRLAWVPQETILFDGARLTRRFEVDLVDDAELVAAEMVVFGRAAHGEHAISGAFRDSWRLRRDGQLVFADETRMVGAIGMELDRGAVGAGARAIATLVVARPDAASALERLRAAISTSCEAAPDGDVEAAASLRDGIIIARFVARTAARLRPAVAAVLEATGGVHLPRIWF